MRQPFCQVCHQIPHPSAAYNNQMQRIYSSSSSLVPTSQYVYVTFDIALSNAAIDAGMLRHLVPAFVLSCGVLSLMLDIMRSIALCGQLSN